MICHGGSTRYRCRVIRETQTRSPAPEIAPRGLEIVSRGLKIVPRGLEIAPRGLEIVSRGLEIASRGPEIVSQGLEIVSQGPEIVSQGLEIASRGLEIASRGLEIVSSALEIASRGVETTRKSPHTNHAIGRESERHRWETTFPRTGDGGRAGDFYDCASPRSPCRKLKENPYSASFPAAEIPVGSGGSGHPFLTKF
jgi:hypothetical protein